MLAPMRALLLAAALCPLAAGCGGGSDRCDPDREACVLEAIVSTTDLGGGVEDEDTCQSWTLDNPTDLWVTGITQHNDGAYHHANWFFVPDDTFELPDGTWSCSDNDFSELNAAILGGYLFAMSTQSLEESQDLPVGSAIRVPAWSRVIGASHLLNASDQPVTTSMHIELRTVPPDQVSAKLAPARIEYHDLQLEPLAKSSFTTDCIIDETYQDVMGVPMTYQIYYALSHYHELGTYSQLEFVGGPRDGEVIFRHDGYGENFGKPFDPPIDLVAEGASGVRYTCGFENPRNEVVGWGIGDQEMCVLALQAQTDMGWQGDVGYGRGAQAGVGDDGEVQFTGPCSILGLPWDHTKPGGPPR
jgi:hypothetical protein